MRSHVGRERRHAASKLGHLSDGKEAVVCTPSTGLSQAFLALDDPLRGLGVWPHVVSDVAMTDHTSAAGSLREGEDRTRTNSRGKGFIGSCELTRRSESKGMHAVLGHTVPRFSERIDGQVFKIVIALVVVAPFLALVLAVWQLWDRGVGWTDVMLLVGTYVPISLGVTAGFHRMLTHRSFVAHPIVKFSLLALGSMAIEGNCIGWAADHLLHHQLSDKKGDPHSPTEGLWHAHLGWLFADTRADANFYCAALFRDPVINFVTGLFSSGRYWVLRFHSSSEVGTA